MNKIDILLHIKEMLENLGIANDRDVFIESMEDCDRIIFQIRKNDGHLYEYEIQVTGGYQIKDDL